MAKRGRPRVSWEHLRDRGAKPSVWKRRRLEDQAELPQPEVTEAPKPFAPDPDAVAAYVVSVQREWNTFAMRTVNGEALTRQYGAPFDWKEGGPGYREHGARYHFAEGKLRSITPDLLQQCKDFAEDSLADQQCGEWTKELSTRFLSDIVTLDGFVFDTEACRNVQRMLAVFAPDERLIPMLRKLAIVEFLCWKDRSTGDTRFDDAELLNFNEEDVVVMDRAFIALQQAVAA